MRLFFLILAAVLTLAACNSYKAKNQSQDESNVLPTSIDFAFVNEKVFIPHCILCHSLAGGNKGDVNMETYENIIANLADIEDSTLIEMTMPPRRAGGPLGAYERNILSLWIAAGAPREANSAPSQSPETGPTPVPMPIPPPPPPPAGTPPDFPTPGEGVVVEPTWDAIYTHILAPKCVSCHQAGGKAEEYPLTDRAFVIDESNLLIKAGYPEQSELYKSIVRADRRMMPPAKTGMTLSQQDKDAVRVWILNGAKD